MGRLSGRAVAALVVLLVAAGAVGAASAGALGGPTAGNSVPGVSEEASVQQASVDATPNASATPAERLECTNGTSEAVVACGYSAGPTAVSLADQQTRPGTVTVEAAALNEGGFVAIHRLSFVDGAFTESVVGVSEHLSPGFHRDVSVAVEPTTEGTLLAVAYRDGDSDGQFDFVATGGATDRPYTNTYTESGGNVTDEAGDVIGDVGTVTSVAGAYDANANGQIEIGELSEAASAYVRGEISIQQLGRVAAAYARSA